jgi:hypothetical protein
MRKSSALLVLAVMAITVTLNFLYAHSRTQNGNLRAETANTSTLSDSQTDEKGSAKIRKGKELVKHLPDGAEGVNLKEGVLRPKAGYKFEKQDDGTVRVASMRGGSGGLGETPSGSWSCGCGSYGGGSCKASVSNGSLMCVSGTCTECILNITVGKVTTGIMRY